MANILVTGGAGYIGSHACKALHAAGFTPVVYDNLCSGNREAVKWGPFIEGDICDREKLAATIEEYRPVAVMHFAALIQVGESVDNPAKYYHNNVYGSYCLVEEARAHGIENIVFSSTAAIVKLGDASYVLYLVHVPMISLMAKVSSHFLPDPVSNMTLFTLFFIFITLPIIVSLYIFTYIEGPVYHLLLRSSGIHRHDVVAKG